MELKLLDALMKRATHSELRILPPNERKRPSQREKE